MLILKDEKEQAERDEKTGRKMEDQFKEFMKNKAKEEEQQNLKRR